MITKCPSAFFALALVFLLPVTALAASPPSITAQPQSQSILTGSNANFSVSATGSLPLSYQWSFNTTNLTNSTHIGGATSATLTVSNITAADNGNYRVHVSNSHGSINSSNATLTVLSPPAITTQPVSQSIVLSNSVVFGTSVTGTLPLSYQWYFNGAPLTDGPGIIGSTTRALSLTNLQISQAGSYQLVVTNNYGSATSMVATLAILVPAMITGQPTNQTTYFGGSASFSVSATGTAPFNYQWYLNGAPLSDNGLFTGSATAVLNISAAQAATIGNYKVIVTNLYGSATSMVATLSATNSTHYVNIAGSNPISPYLNWTTAATNIQDAVDAAYAGDQVIVTNGTYTSGNRAMSGATNCVVITNAISISSVSGPAQTIINGSGTNRCVYLGGGAFLAGFTMTNGATTRGGAGVFCDSLADSISNCVMTGNNEPVSSGSWGGGVTGGTLTNCTLAGNSAEVGGGAYGSVLNHCVVTANSSGAGSGASYCTLNSCMVSSNYSYAGFGTYGAGALNSTLNNCVLQGNQAASDGGAVEGGTLNNCVLIDNYADLIGGGAFAATLNNCLIVGNSTSYLGGGADQCTLINCTVANNSATSDGGGVQGCTLTNCIVYLNSSFGTANYGGSNYMSWCCTTPLTGAGNGDGISGINNISAAPIFVNAATGNYQLYPGSPGIDAGNNSAVSTSVDLDGNSRIVNGTVDMGAYEFQNSPFIETQPSNQIVTVGANVMLTVLAVGTPSLTYQWYLNGVPLSDNSKYSGSGTTTLQILDAQISDTGNYSVTVNNAYGSASSTASLTVVPLVSWGDNSNGQNIIPAAATNTTAIAAGNGFELALKSDGTVIGWGYNADGESSPPPGLTNAVAISASLFLGIALENNQTITVWGSPDFNETNVPPGLSNVVAVAGGDVFGLALKSDGTVATWGDDSYGEGNVPAGLNNVVAIAANSRTALALKNDGTVVAWGDNEYAETNVPSGLSNVVAIAGGENFALALKSDGTITGWGAGATGPTTPPSGLSNVVSVAGGEGFGLALKNDTTVISWGENLNNFNGQSMNETNVPPGLSNVVSISVDLYNSLALVQNPGVQIPPQIWWQGPTNLTFATGQEALFKPYVHGSLPMSYQWFFNGAPLAGQTNQWLALASLQINQTGNYSFIASNNYGSVTSAVMVVSESPGILTQPASQWVVLSNTASFSVSAAGPGLLNYQWYFNGAPLTDGSGITGSATANLVLSNAQANEAGLYQCIVTNNYGSAASAIATLTVYPMTTAMIQPQNLTVMGGTNITFAATITGQGPFSYQWQFDGANIPGATNTNIALTNVLDSQSGAYSLVVSNVTGVLVSSNATLTVAPWVTASVQPATAIAGLYYAPVTFTLQSGGFSTNTIYQWQLSGTNLDSSWVWTNSSQSTSFVPYMENAGPYDIIATDSYASVTSSVVTLTVIPLAIITQPTPSQTVLSGGTASFNVFASGEPTVTFQWMLNGTNVPGATNSTLTLTNVTPPQAGNYSVVLANAFTNITSANAALAVIPLMITNQPTNRITWPNGPATFKVNVAGQPPFGFDWQCNGADVPGILTNVLTITNTQPSQFGTYDVIVSNAWGSATSSNVTLTFSQVAVWGGNAGETNLTPGLTNVIAIAAGSPSGGLVMDCIALRNNGTAIHWPTTNIFYGASNLLSIAGGAQSQGPPFYVLESNGVPASWLVDDIVQPFFGFTNLAAIASENYTSSTLVLTTNGTVISAGPETRGPITYATNAVAIAQGQGFGLALHPDGTVTAFGANPNGTNMPPGLSNVVAIAAGYNNGFAVKSDGTVAAWGVNSGNLVTFAPRLTNVLAIAAGNEFALALMTNGTVVGWGQNISGDTSVPPGLTNVNAIAAGTSFGMALIGNGPPVLNVPLPSPVAGTNGFSISIPSQSGRVYRLQYLNSLTDTNWNSMSLVPGNGRTILLRDPSPTNSQRFYRVQRW